MSDPFWLIEAQMARLRPFIAMACGGGTVRVEPPTGRGRPERGAWPAQDAVQPLAPVARDGRLRADPRRTRRSRSRHGHGHDRREQANAMRSSEPAQGPRSASHGLQPAGERSEDHKTIRGIDFQADGRAIGRTRGDEPLPGRAFPQEMSREGPSCMRSGVNRHAKLTP